MSDPKDKTRCCHGGHQVKPPAIRCFLCLGEAFLVRGCNSRDAICLSCGARSILDRHYTGPNPADPSFCAAN